MSIFEEYRGFWGTGAELTERAKVLSKAMGLKSEKLTERLIRYYASEGVLDKPDRLGREAAYHFRHLLQLLIARRLVSEGVSLIAISKFNLKKSTDELEKALSKPSKDEAKAVTEKYREEVVTTKDLLLIEAQPDAMSDVLSKIKELRRNMGEESLELQKTRHQLEGLFEGLFKNYTETQYEFNERMENQQLEIRHMVMSALELQRKDFTDQMGLMKDQAAIAQEELLFLLSKYQELRQQSK